MEWYLYPIIFAAGFASGFINTLASSGSLITLPVLIFVGLPVNVANGTNRLGSLFQAITAVGSFKQKGVLDTRGGLILSIPAILGSIIGARIAVDLDEQLLRRTIGALMVAMVIIILFRPNRWLEGRPEATQQRPNWPQLLIFFAIGAYGGFIQAGVGTFLLAGLVLGVGYDLIRANAVKMLIILCFTFFALIVFISNDQVWWGVGLLMAVGNGLGGWIASSMAVERGTAFVRWILIAVVLVSAAVLLGLFDLILGLFS